MNFFIIDRDEKDAWDVCYEEGEKDNISWIPFARIERIREHTRENRRALADAIMDTFFDMGEKEIRIPGKVYNFKIEDFFGLESDEIVEKIKRDLHDKEKLVDF